MTQSSPEPSYLPVEAPLPTSGMAIASLVSGILGFTFAPILCSIIAILTGYAARKETRSDPPIASGDGLATAGIIMGYIQIGIAVIGGLCVVIAALSVLVFAAARGQAIPTLPLPAY